MWQDGIATFLTCPFRSTNCSLIKAIFSSLIAFFISSVVIAYDPSCYTKEIHEAVLAEEEAERKLKHNGKNG